MKMRLRPLRGQLYNTSKGDVQLLEITSTGWAKVYHLGKLTMIPIDDLNLSVIDTKDYEKIADEKHKGD